MLSISGASRELNNIPISLSILYDLEYDHLCLFLNDSPKNKRRCFSESNRQHSPKKTTPLQRKTLKNHQIRESPILK